MQPNDSPVPVGSKRPSRSSVSRYAFTLLLLMLIVGGIAWVAQYLPSRGQRKVEPPPGPSDKKILDFQRVVAQWGTKEDDNNKEKLVYKDFETGAEGYYDFLFKNIYETDAEIVHFTSDCDCTSVKACVLEKAEWDRVAKEHLENPGELLSYTKMPEWVSLPLDPARQTPDPAKKMLAVKQNEGGVIRIEWKAKKAAGQELRLGPNIWIQPAKDPSMRGRQTLFVPVKVKSPIQFDPPRVNVGVPSTTKPAEASFHVWSSTRDKLNFELAPIHPNPLFVIRSEELSSKDAAELERSLTARKIPSKVACAYRVTVQVWESKADRYLDQGSFYEKWPFRLDGRLDPEAPIYGPEIVGFVKGDIRIGGADDQGKVRFPSFLASAGASKEVQLTSDVPLELKEFSHKPSWVEVKLTRTDKKTGSGPRTWMLEVTVPPGVPTARSFEEEDAVILQIVGPTPRFVRIPLEGHISAQ